jgi:hypothetical protein
MARQTTHGKCNLCDKTFGKAAMTRHLAKCKEEHCKPGRTRIFHLQVEGYRDYWLHIEIPASATLARLDRFLRNTWLECCGHLSAFTIDGARYDVSPEPDPFKDTQDRSMKVALERVLEVGDKFDHEYDFGTTTELTLKVIAERTGALKANDVKILARNDPPELLCVVCGQAATQLCAYCVYEGNAFYCDEHVGEHQCSEDAFLPVVNSPRMGMCGYTG